MQEQTFAILQVDYYDYSTSRWVDATWMGRKLVAFDMLHFLTDLRPWSKANVRPTADNTLTCLYGMHDSRSLTSLGYPRWDHRVTDQFHGCTIDVLDHRNAYDTSPSPSTSPSNPAWRYACKRANCLAGGRVPNLTITGTAHFTLAGDV